MTKSKVMHTLSWSIPCRFAEITRFWSCTPMKNYRKSLDKISYCFYSIFSSFSPMSSIIAFI